MAGLLRCVCVLVLLLSSQYRSLTFAFELYDHVILIDHNTKDVPRCSPDQKRFIFPNLTTALSCKLNSTRYVLEGGTLYTLHNGSNIFANVHNIALVSNTNEFVVVHCKPGAGLNFQNSSNILIRNVQFFNCGALQNSTTMDYSSNSQSFLLLTFNVTLYFYQCSYVTLDKIAVNNSTFATGVVMYDTVGTNNISYSNFSENGIGNSNNAMVRGGGFLVGFTYCKPDEQNCTDNDTLQSHTNENSFYFFEGCIFSKNYCRAQKPPIYVGEYVYPSGKYHSSFGTGGGLAIFLKSNATNNKIFIRNCTFINNSAIHGSGFYLGFEDMAINNTVSILESLFIGNHPTANDTRGGGMRAVIYAHTTPTNHTGIVVNIDNCTFQNNSAFHGGGLSFSFALQDMRNASQLTNVSVRNTNISNSIAKIGSAVKITLLPMYAYGHLGRMSLTNCSFTNNTDRKSKHLFSSSLGAVFINEVFVFIDDQATFENNTESAVVVSGAVVSFQSCNARFVNNSGANGGAIALLGAAYVLINNESAMTFINNRASQHGGAIYNNYIIQADMHYYMKCFIRYISDSFTEPNKWKARFTFANNSAQLLGNSIYSSSLYPCSWSFNFSANVEKIFCWNDSHWNYSSSLCRDEIFSGPSTFNKINAIYQIFPGQLFHINITAHDELNHNITNQTVYRASISKDDHNAQVVPEFAYTAARFLQVTGIEHQNVTLELDTAGEQEWHIELQLEILDCPPGMVAENNEANKTFKCVCPTKMQTYNKLIVCDSYKYEVRIKRNHWMGGCHNDSKKLFVASCPYFYCMNSSDPDFLILPNTTNGLEKEICRKQNRTGILCGQCIQNFAVAINDYEYTCVQCNGSSVRTNIILYIITTYVPVFIFFLLIIFLNIRLTTGPLNAFILFAQLINSVNLFALPVTLNKYAAVHIAYTFIYGIFNLNFFVYLISPFCINKNFSTLDVLSLDYCIAAFPLVMILVITVAIRLKDKCSCKNLTCRFCENCVMRAFTIKNKALVHSFVAFCLLSYTKFSQASTLIISTFKVIDKDGSLVGPQRVYLAGHYSVKDSAFLYRYGLPSYLIYVVFVILPPLLLLGPLNWFNNRVPNYRCLRRVWPQDKVHIILDTFQGCFKPNMRFFGGVYFVFRLLVFITYAYSNDNVQRYVIQQILVSILLLLLEVFQPYQSKILNRVDSFVFFILAVVNSLSLYAVAQFNASDEEYKTPDSIVITQFAFIFLPLVGVGFYAYFSWNTRCYQVLKDKITCLLKYFFGDSGCDEEQSLLTSSNSRINTALNDDSVLLERANQPNTFFHRVRPASISLQQSIRESESGGSGKTALADYGSRDTISGIASQTNTEKQLPLN